MTAALLPGDDREAPWADAERVISCCPWPAWIQACSGEPLEQGTVAYANAALLERVAAGVPLWSLLRCERSLSEAEGVVPGVLEVYGRTHTVMVRYRVLEHRGYAVAFLVDAKGTERQVVMAASELVADLVMRMTAEGAHTYVNPAYCAFFGRDKLALLGAPIWDLFDADEQACVRELLTQLTPEHPLSVGFEVTRPLADGTAQVFEWSFRGLFDATDALSEVLTVGRDVTARKHVERALGDALREVEKLTRDLESERRYLREEIDALVVGGPVVGNSPEVRTLLEQVASVARTDSTVLIQGETGTGKELVARMIHQSSARAERSLVKVNCAALPGALIESELFGHERGAFTGAVTRRQGRFELAHRGTLFLDEVGEMPLEMQAKLLRALQEQEFERVGSSVPVRVDVRVLAATNRDLTVEVAAGRFRADLYYRLAVFPLHVPALRERRGDIPLLATHFLQRASSKAKKSCAGFSDEAMRWLVDYDWPGNVRELESVVERAVILLTDSVIDLELVRHGPPSTSTHGKVSPSGAPQAHDPDAMLVTLEEMERTYIERVLRRCDGRIEGEDGAAKVLGLAPSTLRSRMQKLRVKR